MNRWATSHQHRKSRTRLRRVAGYATSTGCAGHAGATANSKLTFHLDHSVGADLFVGSAAPAARPLQPSIEATARDTERPAYPIRRPDSPVLRDEGELHVDFLAK